MPDHFDLIITADHLRRIAEFSLRDSTGVQIAWRQTDLGKISASHQHGLFDLRDYLRLYVEEGNQGLAVAEIGVCIAEEVLGKEIFERLWTPQSQRTLRIQLPGAGDMDNHLVAALARVPWEMARPKPDAMALRERNLVVRVVHDMKVPASQPIELAPDEALRVLFVFAESRGSRPLGARKERRELLQLFQKEIYPQRRVVAHFLTHGVTRERLAAQIQENGGYHIVHWSGHGRRNLLELCKPGGASDHLSGAELLELFNNADGFLPRLFFLSACHSGDILRVRDWDDFFAVAQCKELGTKETATRDLDLKVQPGFTGTAHALLQGGVPSVVAMRYAVGDDYAREVAVGFYRALLAHAQPKHVAAALTMARQALQDAKKHDLARFSVCDHATPVLYGADQPGLSLVQGRSPALNPRDPRLHQIAELTTAGHAHFVGRTWELVGLGASFIGSKAGAEVKPVAVITGLGGMGKTALVAEALALWEARFDWVLLYQAKPNRLEFEMTLHGIHIKLMGELGRYHEHVRGHPADVIYRDASAEFTGAVRLERLTRNLLRALKDESILVVLDNFETNLKPADPATSHSACQDPAWDDCLALLAKELPGSPSRVLITCRRPLAALADGAAHSVVLGPLPGEEAALYLKEQPALGRMVFGGDNGEKTLALRLLNASRFHPLLMDRLAKLAANAALRPQLLAALDALEKTKDFAQLPALFAATPGDAKELAYLDDALASSLDQLIRNSSLDARRLLWIIAVANQPEELGRVKAVWSGETAELEQLRKIKQLIGRLPQLSPEMQAKLTAMPPEVHAKLAALPPAGPAKPDMMPLLVQLIRVGLVTEERDAPDDANPNLACHELVRERVRAWMEQHLQDRAELTESTIRLAYAERLEAVFCGLLHKDMAAALDAGICALVYLDQAGAWDHFDHFASRLVTGTSDPRLLQALVPHLRAAVEFTPAGKSRWLCLCNLADALSREDRPDASLPFYEKAVAQARVVADAQGDDSRYALRDLAAITGNWANALVAVGNLGAARQRQRESAAADKKAGSPAINVVISELGALRMDIIQGQEAMALPEVRLRLAKIWRWWRRHRSGQLVPEASDAEILARTLLTALDIAHNAHSAQMDWPPALRQVDASLKVARELGRSAQDIGAMRINRANVLCKLGRFTEARRELEACLLLFENVPVMKSKALGSLAALFNTQGDISHAITLERRSLAICEQFSVPSDRATSHGNLSNYLECCDTSSALSEASRHRLAALIYLLVAGLGRDIQISGNNYVVLFRRARAAGVELVIPRVAELLADPAFAPLEQWLRQRQVPLSELQVAVDQFLGPARQAALESPQDDSSTPN